MALSEFVLALCMLLATLLIPCAFLYQMLRLKRRAIRVSSPAASRGTGR